LSTNLSTFKALAFESGVYGQRSAQFHHHRNIVSADGNNRNELLVPLG